MKSHDNTFCVICSLCNPDDRQVDLLYKGPIRPYILPIESDQTTWMNKNRFPSYCNNKQQKAYIMGTLLTEVF